MKKKKIISLVCLFFIIGGIAFISLPSKISIPAINGKNLEELNEFKDFSHQVEDEYPLVQTKNDIPYSTNPLTGNVSVLAMPIYFSDVMYSKSTDYLEELWNSETDSVKSYYLNNSYGKLNLTATVLDWTLINQPQDDFYGTFVIQWEAELELFGFLANTWDSTVNFSDYDYVHVIFAGDQIPDSGTFWPHAWFGGSLDWETEDLIFDRTAFLSEKSSLGTYCHEFGHIFGLLDYYMNEENTYPVGLWELMGLGSYGGTDQFGFLIGTKPAQLSLYSRLELGWIKEDQIYHLDPNEIMNLNIVPLQTPFVNPDEGFFYGALIELGGFRYYIEYRAEIGSDAYLPDHGLLISRYDPTKGQLEGPLWYIGGNNGEYDLNNPELQDNEDENSEKNIFWLKNDIEMTISVVENVPEAGEIPEYMKVIVDTYHDFGEYWDIRYNVQPGTSTKWFLNDLKSGDIVYFAWDTIDETTRSDYNFSYETAPNVFTELIAYDDVYQDVLAYQIDDAGNYTIEVYNDNTVEKMKVYYLLEIYSAPSYTIDIDIPENNYLIDGETEFTLDIDLLNQKTGWVEWEDVIPGSFDIEFPENFNIIESTGDDFADLSEPIFHNHPKTHSWQINTSSLGAYNISIQYSDVNITYNENITINILEDLFSPSIELDESFPYTNLNEYLVKWIAIDNETGVHRYEFYINGTLVEELISTTSNMFSAPIPAVDGDYNLTVIVYDFLNNSATDSMIISRDGTDPELRNFSGDSTTGEYFIHFDIIEEGSTSIHLKITLEGEIIFDEWIEEDNFLNYEFQLTSALIELANVTDLAGSSLKFTIYDNLENSNIYYQNVGTLLRIESEESPEPEKKIPGYLWLLPIGIFSTLAVIRKAQTKRH